VGRIGTSMVACIAHQHQVPVVVFSETYKFSDKVNLDPINNNEIGNPENIATNSLKERSQNVKKWIRVIFILERRSERLGNKRKSYFT